MPAKKTAAQRLASNSNSGKAKNNKKTIGKEIINNLQSDDETFFNPEYPCNLQGIPESLPVLECDNEWFWQNKGPFESKKEAEAVRTAMTENQLREFGKARVYYSNIIQCFKQMRFLFQPADSVQVGVLAKFLVIRDHLQNEALMQPIIQEPSGNTGYMQSKENPALKASLSIEKVIQTLLTNLGITPMARANILNKLSTLKPADFLDVQAAGHAANDGINKFNGILKKQ